MTTLFSKPKAQRNVAAERAQRRQDQALQRQSADEQKELGARRRIAMARQSGRGSLFSNSAAGGVQDTLG